jgi:hypothetical protein
LREQQQQQHRLDQRQEAAVDYQRALRRCCHRGAVAEVMEKARKEKVPAEQAEMQRAPCCHCSAMGAVERQRVTVEATHAVAAHEKGRHCQVQQNLNYRPPSARTVQSMLLPQMTTAEEVFVMVDCCCCRQAAVGAISCLRLKRAAVAAKQQQPQQRLTKRQRAAVVEALWHQKRRLTASHEWQRRQQAKEETQLRMGAAAVAHGRQVSTTRTSLKTSSSTTMMAAAEEPYVLAWAGEVRAAEVTASASAKARSVRALPWRPLDYACGPLLLRRPSSRRRRSRTPCGRAWEASAVAADPSQMTLSTRMMGQQQALLSLPLMQWRQVEEEAASSRRLELSQREAVVMTTLRRLMEVPVARSWALSILVLLMVLLLLQQVAAAVVQQPLRTMMR